MKILIVDDEPDVRDLLSRTLTYGQPGVTPVEAATGADEYRFADEAEAGA